jgi:NAD(P)-dependent dehydrogenase (short-subunit alcohol dehydrogenase family)
MGRLQDKVIIVTGSTTGIGKAIATQCVAEGARVLIHGLEADLANALVDELGFDNSAGHVEDLAAEGSATHIIGRAISRFGKIDGLVNNAARIRWSDIHDTDEAVISHTLLVNTVAPLMLIRAALPALRETRGTVLNIGSANAYGGEPNLLPYSMSKGALTTMTRNLGDTLFRDDGIRVNQINPGWVLTENEAQRKHEQGLATDWYEHVPKVYAPSGRLIAPEEIAEFALHLLSDACGPISGQVYDVGQFPFGPRNPPKDSSMPDA